MGSWPIFSKSKAKTKPQRGTEENPHSNVAKNATLEWGTALTEHFR